MTVRVNLGNVQGNVVRSYGNSFNRAAYLFFKITDPPSARPRIAEWLDAVVFGDPVHPRKRKPRTHTHEVFVNLAFTFQGLKALKLPPNLLRAFPEDFRAGAQARSQGLGDYWSLQDNKLPLGEADVMLAIHSKSHEGRKRQADWLQRRLPQALQPIHRLDAHAERGELRERFGFADGLSQPAIEGVDIDAVGDGVFAGAHPRGPGLRRQAGLMLEDLGLRPLSRNWRLIRAGEFLLGYENEDGRLPMGPESPLGPDSTFMVYREIDQHPERFDDYVAKAAKRLELSPDTLRAKIVGRWPNGTPALRSQPYSKDAAQNRRRINDFLYREDPQGYRCPLGAHSRRANPRDALPGGAEETMRHRIIRRGMPYRTAEREGLAFVCFNASIENGFEFIQKNWINEGTTFGLGGEADFLLQQSERPTKMVIPGFQPRVLDAPDRPFVQVRGCAYLFVPSRSACSWLRDFLT